MLELSAIFTFFYIARRCKNDKVLSSSKSHICVTKCDFTIIPIFHNDFSQAHMTMAFGTAKNCNVESISRKTPTLEFHDFMSYRSACHRSPRNTRMFLKFFSWETFPHTTAPHVHHRSTPTNSSSRLFQRKTKQIFPRFLRELSANDFFASIHLYS